MNIISSAALAETIELTPGPMHKFGELEVASTDTIVGLTEEHTQQMTEAIRDGLVRFDAEDAIPEETLARKITGLPTMLARIDCSIVDGCVQPFEIEERPNGMGITTVLGGATLNLNHAVQEHFTSLIGTVPTVVAAEDRIDRIDDTFTEIRSIGDGHDGSPVLLRTEPGQLKDEHEELIALSVSTARSEGSKGYRERTGHARVVNSTDAISAEEHSVVIKALQCSKAQHVDIILSADDRAVHGKRGTVTRSRALRNAEEAIARDGAVILERFIPPIKARVGEATGNMILRVFAAVTSPQEIRLLGGVHVTRPELVVHGARNAINGLVIVAD